MHLTRLLLSVISAKRLCLVVWDVHLYPSASNAKQDIIYEQLTNNVLHVRRPDVKFVIKLMLHCASVAILCIFYGQTNAITAVAILKGVFNVHLAQHARYARQDTLQTLLTSANYARHP